MEFNPTLNLEINGVKFTYRLFDALETISQTWSQREAAKSLGISHAVLNRRIHDAEHKLGFKLVYTTGSGSGLTRQAISILDKYHQYQKRLQEETIPVICGGPISSGLLDVLSYHYGLKTVIISTDDLNALKMAEKGLVDVLLLDDPVHAFMHDLDFTPIARDHLVLVSGAQEQPETVQELAGKEFIEIPHSAQRLAWNTLDRLRIDYEIVEVSHSPQNALKRVKSNDDLFTFLNSSFISGIVSGSNLLAEDTMHIINMIIWNSNPQMEDFLEFIIGRGQKIIEQLGFERIE
ncbi:LysR family transcriptional regulator [Methanobacterium petrolearium]|uniref:LysR family transcriptional regulator n=1 Tax=Methanobacterium petrolearium TaxID=710190 RepID=UPI001AE6A981|nr:LysR family transcriptional regulator [Methanobacterium petrolearium]MBP1944960.1 DNA-binding transcriptional LysR family regulator [Methanobacterium petrolearium]BDZ70280.1 transcriptional regulator [Methanobacterium petrolearium]